MYLWSVIVPDAKGSQRTQNFGGSNWVAAVSRRSQYVEHVELVLKDLRRSPTKRLNNNDEQQNPRRWSPLQPHYTTDTTQQPTFPLSYS